jgi:hypothetical protein
VGIAGVQTATTAPFSVCGVKGGPPDRPRPAAGRRQHYLPAGYIGRFSLQPKVPRRDSVLFVQRRGGPIRGTKASAVAWQRDIYTPDGALDGEVAETPADAEAADSFFDDLWSHLEAALPFALDLLQDAADFLDARPWTETLVPFVASLFVRGPDYEARFADRFGISDWRADADLADHITSRDNLNSARLFEMQRLLSPVMRARWYLLEAPPKTRFITSNLGLATFGRRGLRGYVVPLSLRVSLWLVPNLARRIAIGCDDGVWRISVERYAIDSEAVFNINRAMAKHAPAEIYGADKSDLEVHAREMRRPQPRKLLEPMLAPSALLRRNERDLINLMWEISRSPTTSHRWDRFMELLERLRLKRPPKLNYPFPVLLNPSGETGLTADEEEALTRAEANARREEMERLEEQGLLDLTSQVRLLRELEQLQQQRRRGTG